MLGALFVALLWVLLGLVLLLVLVAVTPVRFGVEAATSPVRKVRVWASPIWGFVPAVTLVDSAKPRRKKKKPKPETAKKPTGRARRFDTALGRDILRLILDCLRQIRFERLAIEARFGLGDPAETGAAYGRLCPVLYGTAAARKVALRVTPDFGRACLDGRAEAAAALTPVRLLPPLWRFGWSALARWRAK